MTINFLTLNEVLEIHEELISQYGGAHGVRDHELLLSALAQPKTTFLGQYLHKDIFEMGAAYLYHICKNHPFIDGNKRTAITSALVFFLLNGLAIDADNDHLGDMVVMIANGQYGKKDIVEWFKAHSG